MAAVLVAPPSREIRPAGNRENRPWKRTSHRHRTHDTPERRRVKVVMVQCGSLNMRTFCTISTTNRYGRFASQHFHMGVLGSREGSILRMQAVCPRAFLGSSDDDDHLTRCVLTLTSTSTFARDAPTIRRMSHVDDHELQSCQSVSWPD